MPYKVKLQEELNSQWGYLRNFGEPDDNNEEQRLISLCTQILHYASEVGDLEKIVLLINRIQDELGIEIDVNETMDRSEQTPLIIASGEGYPDIVDFLILNGANVNLARRDGTTPLIAVAQNSIMNKDVQLYIVEKLIESKADVNVQEEYGKTPLILATESKSPKIVSKLLLSGADTELKDKEGDTALDIAISNEMKDIETIIREHKNNQNEPKTPVKKSGGTKKRKKNKKKRKINKSKRRKAI